MNFGNVFSGLFEESAVYPIPPWITAFLGSQLLKNGNDVQIIKKLISSHSPQDGREGSGPLNLKRSKILNVLDQRILRIETVFQSGKVLWFNRDLAQELGMDLPPFGELPDEYEQKLLQLFSRRVVAKDESVKGIKTQSLFADRYTGLEGNYGAGRAGFSEWGDLYIKGIGKTPLVGPTSPYNFSYGGLPLREAIIEAVLGEICQNLFQQKGARVLVIIGIRGGIKRPGYFFKEPRAISVRHGSQLRFAHFLDYFDYLQHLPELKKLIGSIIGETIWHQVINLLSGMNFDKNTEVRFPDENRVAIFIKATKFMSLLQTHVDDNTNIEEPDLAATIRAIINLQACMAVEQVRWRFIHGGASESNFTLNASMLDVTSSSTQPRTAQYRIVPTNMAFAEEGWRRPYSIRLLYDGLIRGTHNKNRIRFNLIPINIEEEYKKAYELHFQHVILKAMGIRDDYACQIFNKNSEEVRKFSRIIMKFVDLQNGSKNPILSIDDNINKIQLLSRIIAQFFKFLKKSRNSEILTDAVNFDLFNFEQLIRQTSIVDVFNVLRRYPRLYFFSHQNRDVKNLISLLQKTIIGDNNEIQKKEVNIEQLSKEFIKSFDKLMQITKQLIGNDSNNWQRFQKSMIARAEFENRPIEPLFVWKFYPNLLQVYLKSFKDKMVIRSFINTVITVSLRNVDSILQQGSILLNKNGDIEVQIRDFGKMRMSVIVSHDGSRSILVKYSPKEIMVSDTNEVILDVQDENGNIKKYISGEMLVDENGTSYFVFLIPVETYDIGILHTKLIIDNKEISSTNSYVYAIPDDKELEELLRINKLI